MDLLADRYWRHVIQTLYRTCMKSWFVLRLGKIRWSIFLNRRNHRLVFPGSKAAMLRRIKVVTKAEDHVMSSHEDSSTEFWVSTHLKNMQLSKWVNIFFGIFGVKIPKNLWIWNHHLAIFAPPFGRICVCVIFSNHCNLRKILGFDLEQTPKIASLKMDGCLVKQPFPTVDGWNPAPVDMVNFPLFTGFHTSQVVQDFSHQQ